MLEIALAILVAVGLTASVILARKVRSLTETNDILRMANDTLRRRIAPFDRDNDGKPGGSKPRLVQ